MRFAECIVAVSAWSYEDGHWKASFYAVYVLDSLSSLLFFTLSCVLSMFWAEMYHISEDSPTAFRNILVPLTTLLNIGMLTSIILFWYSADSSWSSGSYSDGSYPYIVLSFYIIGALLLLYYSHKATNELGTAPVDIALRTERLSSIKFLSTIVVIALIGRGILLMIIVNSDISIHSAVSWIIAFLWFVCVDYTPLSLCLYHYWKVAGIVATNRDYLKESVERSEDTTSLLKGTVNTASLVKQQQLPKKKSDDGPLKPAGDDELTI